MVFRQGGDIVSIACQCKTVRVVSAGGLFYFVRIM